MLDMGFKPAVDRIVRLIPKDRQTLFFSATLEGAAGKLAATYTQNARTHVNAPRHDTRRPSSIASSRPRARRAKIDPLVTELATPRVGRTLVFVRTKRGADRLVKRLKEQNVHALAMHGDKSQAQRQKALASSSAATSTSSSPPTWPPAGSTSRRSPRVNFDIPEDSDAYTHRVGSTGRAGPAASASASSSATRLTSCAGIAVRPRPLDRVRSPRGRSPSPSRPSPTSDRDSGGRNHSRQQSQGGNNRARNQGGGGSTGPKRRRRNPSGNNRSQGSPRS